MNEDTLILYYYNDGLSESERREVEVAINADADIAARYDDLCRQLNGLQDAETTTVPAHTVQRWHDALDREARLERGRMQQPRHRKFSGLSFAWGAAVAAALVALGVLGLLVVPLVLAAVALLLLHRMGLVVMVRAGESSGEGEGEQEAEGQAEEPSEHGRLFLSVGARSRLLSLERAGK